MESATVLCRKYVTEARYDRAAMHCAAAANDGDTGSEAALGWMYFHGKGLPHNEGEAVRWTRTAAENGNVAAEAMLGGMYLHGKGVPKDREEARRWIAKAAADGHKGAQVALGNLYAEAPVEGDARITLASTGGSSEPVVARPEPRAKSAAASAPDPEAAVKWYRKAARNGSSAGQTAMGEAYRRGVGVGQDDERAYMWFTLAARQGSGKAAEARASLARHMTDEQIRRAEDKASDWQDHHADKTAEARATARR